MPDTQKAKLSIRIDFPNGSRLGPGKAALLKAIDSTETITAAAIALGMSYPRALKLIDQLNAAFAADLIRTEHGGRTRGGAFLTDEGRTVLSLYQSLCDRAGSHFCADLENLTSMCSQD